MVSFIPTEMLCGVCGVCVSVYLSFSLSFRSPRNLRDPRLFSSMRSIRFLAGWSCRGRVSRLYSIDNDKTCTQQKKALSEGKGLTPPLDKGTAAAGEAKNSNVVSMPPPCIRPHRFYCFSTLSLSSSSSTSFSSSLSLSPSLFLSTASPYTRVPRGKQRGNRSDAAATAHSLSAQ